MPNDPDVRVTSHDRHDPMLVAALAAGDLAGTERDQAIAQTQTCRDCAALHDDLVAIARATAALPPPIRSAGRDFRLTPKQAAELRRGDWRRFLPSIQPGSSGSRNLGIALATFGLVGLFIGSVGLPLGGFGSSGAAAPAPATVEAPVPAASGGPEVQGDRSSLQAYPVQPAASTGAASAAASTAPASSGSVSLSGLPGVTASASADYGRGFASDGTRTAASGAPGAVTGPATAAPSGAGVGKVESTGSPAGEAPSGASPLTYLFEGIIVVGLVLIVTSRRRRSPTD